MLALSPTQFSPIYGWPSEDLIQQECNDISIEAEANSHKSFLDFHTYNDIHQDSATEIYSFSGEVANGDFSNPMLKKLNHNASERDRRKRVNDLYAFLRSVLPNSSDQKKKISIPGTVSRALKYIPELQKEVATLIRKKEKLSLDSSSKYDLRQQGMKNKIGKDAKIETKSSVVSSVKVLGAKEAVIQLISLNDHMSKTKKIGLLSKVMEYLEKEEDIVLINSTTFKCFGEGMSLLSTLHIQVNGENSIDAERLKEKLCSFHQQADRLFLSIYVCEREEVNVCEVKKNSFAEVKTSEGGKTWIKVCGREDVFRRRFFHLQTTFFPSILSQRYRNPWNSFFPSSPTRPPTAPTTTRLRCCVDSQRPSTAAAPDPPVVTDSEPYFDVRCCSGPCSADFFPVQSGSSVSKEFLLFSNIIRLQFGCFSHFFYSGNMNKTIVMKYNNNITPVCTAKPRHQLYQKDLHL
ncbi:hypothetical protein LXL04_000293 [Taraxacum kok-saghyz]